MGYLTSASTRCSRCQACHQRIRRASSASFFCSFSDLRRRMVGSYFLSALCVILFGHPLRLSERAGVAAIINVVPIQASPTSIFDFVVVSDHSAVPSCVTRSEHDPIFATDLARGTSAASGAGHVIFPI